MKDFTLDYLQAKTLYIAIINGHKLLMDRYDYGVEDFAKCSKTLNNLSFFADMINKFMKDRSPYKLKEDEQQDATDATLTLDKDNDKNEKGEEYEQDKSFPR